MARIIEKKDKTEGRLKLDKTRVTIGYVKPFFLLFLKIVGCSKP